MPVLIDCTFTVDSSNANGLGISSLKGAYVQNVFMHTSQTPGAGSSNPQSPNIVVTNPNPAAGYIVVQLQDNYNKLLSNGNSIVSPVGTPVKIDNSAMTAGVAYVITTLGNATAAKWLAIGVPAGVTPAVGVSFIAASNGGAGNTLTSRVAPIAAAGSTVNSIELVGDSNLALAPSITAQGFGSQIILACFKEAITMNSYTPAGTNSAPALTMNSYTPAGTNDGSTPPLFTGTPATLTGTVAAPAFTGSAATLTGTSAKSVAAPSDLSVIRLSFLLSNSSILIGGQ